MAMPQPTPRARQLFDGILPKAPGFEVRPMFGNFGGFLNGHMFIGVFGDAVFVRLPETERAKALKEPGAGPFEPMKGRPMKEYVCIPPSWGKDPKKAQAWVAKSVKWVGAMPAKGGKKPAARRSTPSSKK